MQPDEVAWTRRDGAEGSQGIANAGDLVAGRYRLIELVGRGGMGRVWRAWDEVLEREVALKEILPPEGITAGHRQMLISRIRREAKIAAGLDHRGIVRVYDIFEHDGAPVIVMQFVAGQSLQAVIDEQRVLSPEQTGQIGAAVSDALAHAHGAGVIHRDLKPENILLAVGHPVITDFGIARLADGDMTMTTPGARMGTPHYMSPEQVAGKALTAASDLWSLGATLYAAVEGHPPFSGDTLEALFAAITTQPPIPPQRAGDLEPLLSGLLVKDPGQRRSADWAARYLAHLGGKPGQAEIVPRVWRPRRRTVLLAGVGVAIAAIAVPVGLDLSTAPSGSRHGSPGAHRGAKPAKAISASAAVILLENSDGGVNAVAFSPDGKTLASASGDGTVMLWDTVTHANTATLQPPGNASSPSATCVAFSPDGKILASANADSSESGWVTLWDVVTNASIATLGGGGPMSSVAFSPDGKILASGVNTGEDVTVMLWDTATHANTAALNGDGFGAEAVAFSPDGKTLATTANYLALEVQLWAVATGSNTATLNIDPSGAADSIAFSPDGAVLAIVDVNGTVQLWDAQTFRYTATLTNISSNAYSVAFSPDGTILASGNQGGTISLWDVATRVNTTAFDTGTNSKVSGVAFSPDGKSLSNGGTNLMLWTIS